MAITRRQFLTRTGILTAGSLAGSSIFANPFLRRALADTITPADHYIISLYLDGGNDGLNTVAPRGDGTINLGGLENLRQHYQTARGVPPMNGTGGIRLTTTELDANSIGNDPGTNAPLGLHPGLGGGPDGGIKNLYNQGDVAVILGAGYPEPNLSHDESRTKWETADPLGTAGYGNGWVGRHLELNYSGTAIPAFCVRGDVPGEFIQSVTSVLAVSRLQDFGFPYDEFDQSMAEQTARDAAFTALYSEAKGSAQSLLSYTGNVGGSTYDATQIYPQLSTDYQGDRPSYYNSYNQGGPNNQGSSTSRDFREIAKVIYGVTQGAVNTRFFELRNGGYDTHSDQGGGATGGQQFNLHREVSDAVAKFALDMQNMGTWNKVVIMIWSEFGRRVDQNDNGTDHGSQAPVFVIGGGVTGGVYGKFPNIEPNSLDDGNTIYLQGAQSTAFRSTDIRDIYGTILRRWAAMPSDAAVQAILPLDPSGYDANYYWRTANFGMGFLP